MDLLITAASLAILVVGDFFHPIDDFAVERFLNGDMRHRRCWSRSMPMLLARRKQDHIAGTDLLNWTVLALRPAAAGYDDQRLTQRVCMPCSSSAGLECDASAGRACRSVCLKQGIDPYRAGKPIGRSFAGRL
jgi:hypothetical protein